MRLCKPLRNASADSLNTLGMNPLNLLCPISLAAMIQRFTNGLIAVSLTVIFARL